MKSESKMFKNYLQYSTHSWINLAAGQGTYWTESWHNEPSYDQELSAMDNVFHSNNIK